MQSQQIIEEKPAIGQDDEAEGYEYFDCIDGRGSFEVFEASVVEDDKVDEDRQGHERRWWEVRQIQGFRGK